ncbi:MAG: class E sortase [Acidimicrobiia bacterium]|nr:class E sortase [Acidimicrobiia bacterium]
MTVTVDEEPGSQEPAAPPPSRTARRRRPRPKGVWRVVHVLGWVFIWLGLAVLWFAIYTLWGTRAQTEAAQRELQQQLQERIDGFAHIQGSAAPTPEQQQEMLGHLSADTAKAGPLDGVARIRIPKLGVSAVVVNGTDREALQHGPGLFDVHPDDGVAPVPAAPGNTTIAGHRTTFGAEFNRIDELVPGDQIFLDTVAGTTAYTVAGQQVVDPLDTSVALQYGDNRLTLSTCNPKFSARTRLIVTAMMSAGPFMGMPPPPAETAAASVPALPGGGG